MHYCKQYKKWIGIGLCALVVGVNLLPSMRQLRAMPESITMQVGDVRSLLPGWPFSCSMEEQEEAAPAGVTTDAAMGGKALYSVGTGTGRLSLRLLGLIPVKTVRVTVNRQKELIPGGQSIGVSVRTQGALVIGRTEIQTAAGKANPARDAGIQAGDVIRAVNGQEVENAAGLSETVRNSQGEIHLTVRRGEQTMDVTITPAEDIQDGSRRLGIWVRDSTAGVGTLTYMDPEDASYGALGHAISDSDTGDLYDVRIGKIYRCRILDIHQGAAGSPGELRGNFNSSSTPLGSIARNTELGIYGRIEDDSWLESAGKSLPVASPGEVHTGKATILTTIDDEGVKAYDVQILRLSSQSAAAPKSMVLQVTDPILLEKTGGILQGMSGSPILQDGAIVGAVTHVFINDPTKGYGLYIQWMLEQDNALEIAG